MSAIFKIFRSIALAIAGTIALLAIGVNMPKFNCTPPSPAKTQPNTGSKIEAWTMAQQFIKQYLKSPSTARFDDQSYERAVSYLGDGRYVVSGWVDSQNGFGAMLRSHFRMELRCDGSTWLLLKPPVFLP